jgi:hypothetical protein
LLSGFIKDIEFKTYREMNGEVIPLPGIIKCYSLSRVLTEAAESFLKDVLVPIYHASTPHVQVAQGAAKKWMHVARTWYSKKSSALKNLARKST